MASALEMTDQMSVATTRLDESRVWREVRQQRRERFRWRRVSVLGDAGEERPLSHHDSFSRTNACLKARSARATSQLWSLKTDAIAASASSCCLFRVSRARTLMLM